MKIFILFFISLLPWTHAFGQGQCPQPESNVVVYFGNGILTTRNSAERSLSLLKDELGSDLNSQRISYALAYNGTSGAFGDLFQSAQQAGIQFDSQLMGWFNHIGVAPAWFNTWHQDFIMAESQNTASELTDHVSSYRDAILLGQKILVISHSQGNFYSNAAKNILQAELDTEQMKGFQIFGVATPASNVGGATSPYFTNHRDIISTVPGSLPSNWALHHSNGMLADDIQRLDAHFFDSTYMSNNFDIKQAMIVTIKNQINSLQTPTANCQNYRIHFVSMLAGTYRGKCSDSSTAQVASIDHSALVNFPNGAVNISTRDMNIDISRGLVNTSNVGDSRGISLNAIGTAGGVGGTWTLHGQYLDLMSIPNPVADCPVQDAPSTFIGKPVDITSRAIELLDGYRTILPKNKCTIVLNGVLGGATRNQAVSFSGTTLTVGSRSYSLTAERAAETVSLLPPSASTTPEVEEFALSIEYKDSSVLRFIYKQIYGLNAFSYYSPSERLFISCIRD